MSFLGGSSQGEIRYAIVVDDMQANAKLQNFTTSVNKLGQPTQMLSQNMATLNRNFSAGLQPIQKSGDALNNINNTITTSGQRFQKLGGYMKDNVVNAAVLSSGIAQLDNSYLSLHKAQVANERANLMVSKSQQQVAKLTESLNKLQRDGKTGTAEYALKTKDLELAQEKLRIVEERQTVTQENLNERTEDFWNSIIPNAMTIGGSAFNLIKELGVNMENLGKVTSKAGDFFTSTAGKISILGGGIAAASLVINSYLGYLRDVNNAHQVLDKQLQEHARNWTEVRKSFEQIQFGIESDPIRLAVTSLSGSLDTLKKEITSMKNLEQLGPIIDNILVGDQFQVLPQRVKDMVSARLNYIKRALSNPDNFVDEATAKTSLEIISAGLADVDNLINKSLPTWAKNKASIDLSTQSLIHYVDTTKEMSRTAQGDTTFTNSITKAEMYSHAILDVNQKLVQHAQELNVDQGLINKYAYSTGQSTDQIIANNLQLKMLIHSHGGYVPAVEESTKATDTFTEAFNKQVAEAKLSMDATTGSVDMFLNVVRKYNTFAKEFNQNKGIIAALEIKSDPNKMTKQILDSLPNNIEKKIKANLKMQVRQSDFSTGFQNTLQGLIDASPKGFIWSPDLQMDDKTARETAKGIIKDIDKQFGKGGKNADDKTKNLRNALQAALDAGAGQSRILEILSGMIDNAPPLKVHLVNADGSEMKVLDPIQNYANKNPVEVPWYFSMDNVNPLPVTKGSKSKKGLPKSFTDQFPGVYGGGGGKVIPTLYKGNDMPRGAIGVNEYGQYVDKNGKVLGLRGSNINIPGGTLPGGNYPGGAYGGSNQTMSPFPNKVSMIDGKVANPLDVMARQFVQITKDINMLARATVQLTKDNNMLARTINQITTNNNMLARTTVQVTKDYNLEARTIVQTTSDNNMLARTIVQITKDNNILAKTTVQITKDYNTLARVVVQNTKNNNTFARTIDQVTKNFKSGANAADGYTSALKRVESQARQTAAALRSIPGTRSAAVGMHETLSRDTLILAHANERVDIGGGASSNSNPFSTSGGGGGMSGTLVVNLTNVNSDRETIRTYRKELGKDMYRFGPT